MLFMVVERFEDGDMAPVYRRLAERGRMLPDGVRYVASWVAADFSACWQVMECEDPAQLDVWMTVWAGAGVRFENVIPVLTSEDARAAWAARAESGQREM